MIDFWLNHFNVFGGKGLDHLWVGRYEDEAIRPYALGHFRDLLMATARSPAMVFLSRQSIEYRAGEPGGARRQHRDQRGVRARAHGAAYARRRRRLHPERRHRARAHLRLPDAAMAKIFPACRRQRSGRSSPLRSGLVRFRGRAGSDRSGAGLSRNGNDGSHGTIIAGSGIDAEFAFRSLGDPVRPAALDRTARNTRPRSIAAWPRRWSTSRRIAGSSEPLNFGEHDRGAGAQRPAAE